MAAWDKLMALPKQQYPSFKALRKRQKAEPYANVEATINHKKADLEFPKNAVPLGQLMPVSDKNVKAIEVYYGGMSIAPTHMHKVRFSRIDWFIPDLPPDSVDGVNQLLEDDRASLRIRSGQFEQFIRLLNNIKAWKYPDPIPDYHSIQHRLLIVVYYQDGTKWALASDSRFEKDQYLEAMIVPDFDFASEPEKYDFVYISLRDVLLLMQHLDDRVPVFLERYDNPPYSVNERRQWKELLDQP